MVREFGLSEAIGPVSYSGPPAGYPALAGSRGYSEHIQWLVDQEVAALLTGAEARARDLLSSHRQALAQLTTALLEQETVTGDQVRAIAQAASPAPSTAAIGQVTDDVQMKHRAHRDLGERNAGTGAAETVICPAGILPG